MQNHHQQSSPTAKKPPRPPPLSVSLPANPDPPTPTRPEPKFNSDESPHSPLRSESPLRSDDPQPPASSPPSSKNSNGGGAIVAVEKYYSPLTSPVPTTPPDSATSDSFPPPISHHHVISFNRREEPRWQSGVAYGGGGRGGRNQRMVESAETSKEGLVCKVALGLRVLEFVFCLVSFSVMASNTTQGWSGDSFDRYKEYRFCLAVTIIGFVYSGFQAYDLSYYLTTEKHVITQHLHRLPFDFILDQILAYLLISASSAAASRIDNWEANWGKNEFTEKASASISMALLAFIAFALSSLISGYNLCIHDFSS